MDVCLFDQMPYSAYLHKKEKLEHYGCLLRSIPRDLGDFHAIFAGHNEETAVEYYVVIIKRSSLVAVCKYCNQKPEEQFDKTIVNAGGVLFSEMYFYLIVFIDSSEIE